VPFALAAVSARSGRLAGAYPLSRRLAAGPPDRLLHSGWGYEIYPFDRQLRRSLPGHRVVDAGSIGLRTVHAIDALPSTSITAADETRAVIEALGLERPVCGATATARSSRCCWRSRRPSGAERDRGGDAFLSTQAAIAGILRVDDRERRCVGDSVTPCSPRPRAGWPQVLERHSAPGRASRARPCRTRTISTAAAWRDRRAGVGHPRRPRSAHRAGEIEASTA
jgi:hypothetical protein